MSPFEKINAEDIKLKSADVYEYIEQMVDFHASRIDKTKPNATADIINDFLRIMRPLKDELDYWIEFFDEKKAKMNEPEVEDNQITFLDIEENSL